MIAFRVEAEKGNPESILAAGRAMAASRVTTGLHEDWHHIKSETDRRVVRRLGDFNRDQYGLATECDREACRTLSQRRERRSVPLHERRVRQGESGLRRHVSGDTVGVSRLGHD